MSARTFGPFHVFRSLHALSEVDFRKLVIHRENLRLFIKTKVNEGCKSLENVMLGGKFIPQSLRGSEVRGGTFCCSLEFLGVDSSSFTESGITEKTYFGQNNP
jgi:hypothetical protein